MTLLHKQVAVNTGEKISVNNVRIALMQHLTPVLPDVLRRLINVALEMHGFS
jgi:spore coat protein CotF